MECSLLRKEEPGALKCQTYLNIVDTENLKIYTYDKQQKSCVYTLNKKEWNCHAEAARALWTWKN